ncbi:MAG: glycosyltransferase [Acidobacteriaceae bacterium]
MDKNTKVLHLIASGFYGGPEKQILTHVRSLRESGINACICSFEENGQPELLKRAQYDGIPTYLVKKANIINQSIQLKTILHENNIQALCTHGFKANVIGYILSHIIPLAQLAFVRGWTAETTKVRFYEVLDRWVLTRIAHVVCVARPQAQYLKRRRDGLNPPIVLPNAALRPENDPINVQNTSDVLIDVIPNNAFILGSVGRLSIEKGHADLIEAMIWLNRNVPNNSFHCVILGDGRETSQLQKQASASGISHRVHFYGFRRDISPYMEHFNCLVQPSHTEGTPNSILEAMLVGVPIVATSVGGVPDIIEHGLSGLLIPPHNPVALAQSILQLASSGLLCRRLSNGAILRSKEFSPETHFHRMMEIYNTVFDSKE